MYMDGPVAYARLVIMVQSIQDIFDRWSWLTNLARSDLRLIRHYRAQEETLRAVGAEAEKEFGRWEGFRNKREKTKRRIAALYGRRSRQLALLEKRKENRATLLRELSGARAELRDAIVSLFRNRDTRLRGGTAAIERLKGLLPWPVEGSAVSPSGGDDEGRGIRIRARGGSPIRVVARGEVVFSDWIRGYGRMLILRHEGEYYTVYGGAGEVLVEKGEVPPDGSVIARVGATSALGEPSLYFEIRKGAIPLDPLRWLSSRPK
jgi:septal ring factor EnvC (AmiA/AmiB activator)